MLQTSVVCNFLLLNIIPLYRYFLILFTYRWTFDLFLFFRYIHNLGSIINATHTHTHMFSQSFHIYMSLFISSLLVFNGLFIFLCVNTVFSLI